MSVFTYLPLDIESTTPMLVVLTVQTYVFGQFLDVASIAILIEW